MSEQADEPPQHGTRNKSRRLSVSRVVSAIGHLEEKNGSRYRDIREALESESGHLPSLVQMKSVIQRGLKQGVLLKNTQTRFVVNNAATGCVKFARTRRRRSVSIGSSTRVSGNALHRRRRRRRRRRGRRGRRRSRRRRRRRSRRGRRGRRRRSRRRRRRRRRSKR